VVAWIHCEKLPPPHQISGSAPRDSKDRGIQFGRSGSSKWTLTHSAITDEAIRAYDKVIGLNLGGSLHKSPAEDRGTGKNPDRPSEALLELTGLHRRSRNQCARGLMIKAVVHHNDECWVLLYIERWLRSPCRWRTGRDPAGAGERDPTDSTDPRLDDTITGVGQSRWVDRLRTCSTGGDNEHRRV